MGTIGVDASRVAVSDGAIHDSHVRSTVEEDPDPAACDHAESVEIKPNVVGIYFDGVVDVAIQDRVFVNVYGASFLLDENMVLLG